LGFDTEGLEIEHLPYKHDANVFIGRDVRREEVLRGLIGETGVQVFPKFIPVHIPVGQHICCNLVEDGIIHIFGADVSGGNDMRVWIGLKDF
jgi:hypothetical protein